MRTSRRRADRREPDRGRSAGTSFSRTYGSKWHHAGPTLLDGQLPGPRFDRNRLDYNNLTGVNLAGQNLTNANSLSAPTLTNANLSQANLTNANFADATLTGANLTGAEVRGAASATLFQGRHHLGPALLDGQLPGPRFDRNRLER